MFGGQVLIESHRMAIFRDTNRGYFNSYFYFRSIAIFSFSLSRKVLKSRVVTSFFKFGQIWKMFENDEENLGTYVFIFLCLAGFQRISYTYESLIIREKFATTNI